MVIGTHNTMTFLKPKFFLFKYTSWFWRCQKKTLREQWEKGVCCFDLRVNFEKDGTPYFAHGIVKLKGDVYQYIEQLKQLSSRNILYVRLVCEDLRGKEQSQEYFIKFCKYVETYLSDAIVFEGRLKKGWKLLYDFDHNFNLNQYVGSMASNARWYERFIPILYAKRLNQQMLPQEDITIYDFI